MGTEIERKFLVETRPEWLNDCVSERIEQGYLAQDQGVEVRLRKFGSSLVLTVKSGHGLERGETEIALSEAEFGGLWPLTQGRRLVKRRYRRPTEFGTFEIDVYEDTLEGLITAEIEVGSRRTANDLPIPDWVADEVTGDDRYSNYELAVGGMPAKGTR